MTGPATQRTIRCIEADHDHELTSNEKRRFEILRRLLHVFRVVKEVGVLAGASEEADGSVTQEWQLSGRFGTILLARESANQYGKLATLSQVRNIGREESRAIDVIVFKDKDGEELDFDVDWLSGILPPRKSHDELLGEGLRRARIVDPSSDALGELSSQLDEALSSEGLLQQDC